MFVRASQYVICLFSLLFGDANSPSTPASTTKMLTATSAIFLILASLSALRIRSLLERLFAVVQRCLTRGLGGSHRLKLLALLAQSRLRLLFARADELEVQGRGLGRTFGPTCRPGLRLEDIVA